MQNPLVIGIIVFGVILVGALVGWMIKECLPKHHQMRQAVNALQTELQAEVNE